MCWLYSVPNLLVFQQLDILYLCENYVRAVCERVWRFQVWAFRVILTSDLWLATRKNTTHVKHAGSWRVTIARALQDKNGQSSLAINSRIKLTTHPSCKWVARMPCFTEKWLFTFLTYPTIYILIPTKCRELSERILREKTKIDSSTILDIWFSKFLYSHHLHWHIFDRFISQILISLYSNQWGGILVLGKQFEDDQFTWLMQWAYCRIRKAKEDIESSNLCENTRACLDPQLKNTAKLLLI